MLSRITGCSEIFSIIRILKIKKKLKKGYSRINIKMDKRKNGKNSPPGPSTL
jgi:hypothetical protein